MPTTQAPPTIIKVGGIVVEASAAAEWDATEGTGAVIRTFDISPADAARIESGYKGAPISIEGENGGKPFTWQNLYIVGVTEGDHPSSRRLRVADRRVWLANLWIKHIFNLRRNTGTKRLIDPATANTPELQPLAASVTYAEWSLKSQTQGWTAADVLDEIMGQIVEWEKAERGSRAGFRYEFDRTRLNAVPIEDLLLDDAADAALARVFAYLPQIGITVDPDGAYRLYDKTDGGEAGMVALAGSPVPGTGDIQLVSNRYLRPREIHLLYTIKSEFRADFIEQGSYANTVSRGDNDRALDNVLPVPDFQLTVNGQTVVQNTWITFPQALAAWGPLLGWGQIDFPILQEAFVPFLDLWGGFALSGLLTPTAEWMGRVAAMQTHYRQTFRLTRRWMDRIYKLTAERIGTVDPQSGQRAEAVCYSDYAYPGTMRSVLAESPVVAAIGVLADFDYTWMKNVKGYPNNSNGPVIDGVATGTIDSTSKPAPAKVSVVDHDQGIVHLEFRGDPLRLHDAVLPSMVTLGDKDADVAVRGDGTPSVPGPTADFTDITRPISFNAVSNINANQRPKLTREDKKAVILSAIPSAPNNKHGLYRVVIKPGDVADALSSAASKGLGDALGPPMEIRIRPSMAMALIPWSDARAADIEAIFGIGDTAPNLAGLVMNDTAQEKLGTVAASLQELSKAVAARIYASLTDRLQGTMSVPFEPNVRPQGWLSSVAHIIDTQGRGLTRLTCPERIPSMDVYQFMDSGTRALLLKIADPGKTG
jgi:hypothetical protein